MQRYRGPSCIVACVQATGAPTQASLDEVALPLAALMRHLVTETSPDFFKEVERLDLSFTQVKAMNLLSDGDPLSVKGMSDAIGLSLAGVSRAVEGLVQRGMVKRAENPDDRRAKQLTLTAKGRNTMQGLVRLRLAGVRIFVAELDRPQREALRGALELVMEHPDIKLSEMQT